jgi:hypothetical protein
LKSRLPNTNITENTDESLRGNIGGVKTKLTGRNRSIINNKEQIIIRVAERLKNAAEGTAALISTRLGAVPGPLVLNPGGEVM